MEVESMNIDFDKIGKLGFGMMRLPKRGMRFNMKQVEEMVDTFLENGFNYFDTAYVYVGSENATRKALVKRYPRDSYTLATKMYALPGMPEAAVKREFKVSMKQLDCEYIDYYLLHSLMDSNYKKYDKQKLWEFALEQKEHGLVNHVGFSYHAGPELLDQILTEHPETEFVQLQINYMDWDDPKIASGANYRVARKHNVPIVIMEPVKGGKLANPPKDVKGLLLNADPSVSYASWAMRFAANLDGVLTVLSGMSDMHQMQDNILHMKDLKPFTDEEQKIIEQARVLLAKSDEIHCSGCNYCIKDCPMGIPIPDIFKAMNSFKAKGKIKAASKVYANAVAGKRSAGDCIGCAKCESICPQHIEIVKNLKDCSSLFD